MNNITSLSIDKCTGCGSCYNVCPVDAISMKHDIDGFLVPVIDKEICVLCEKCVSSCPVCNPIFNNNNHPECYAAMAQDEELRMKSSSGGMFSLFAEEIFKRGGVVSGAAYDDNFLVEHIIIDKIEDLNKLRGSKYLQSDTKKVYRDIKNKLNAGQFALFCGCPCQVGALNTFLGKDYPNLLTIDLMCHGGPSPLLFKKYLAETYPGRELEHFSFRDKIVFGWSTEANAYFKDGKSEHIKRNQDDYYRAFLPCLSVRKSCGTCTFAVLPRQGDVTLADFWGVRKYNKDFDDGKGTSIVILNSKKGKEYYKLISSRLKLNEQVPFDYIITLGQPFDKPFKNHPERDRYFEIVRKNSVKKAFHYIKNRKFDVGVIGVWPGLNYGSVLTYYALQKTLREMGLSPLMIDKPGASKDDIERLNTHSRRFAKEHFHISQPYALKDLNILNRHCDTFIIGSDQVWNYGISKNFGKSFYLDFVDDNKKKIAYAVSFGHNVDFAPPAERVAISRLMRRFDAIAVREDNGVQLCKDIYGVEATHVLDPVFLIDPEQYHELANRSTCKEEAPYMLAYILDVTPEKKELMLQMSRDLGLRLLVLLDGFSDSAEKNRKILDLDENVRMNIEVYDWLYYFKNASYVLTDSFHGTSYAILFGKQFLPLTNKRRGYARFASLAHLLDFESRLINEPIEAIQNKKYMEVVNYDYINRVITTERTRCRDWLHNALFSYKNIESMSSYPILDKNFQKNANINDNSTREILIQTPDTGKQSNLHTIENNMNEINTIMEYIQKQKKKEAYLDIPKHILYQCDNMWSLENKEWFIRKEVYKYCKYIPNLKNPKTFNEKTNFYKLHYKNPLMTTCADKYAVKYYIESVIGKKYVNETYLNFTNIDDIDINNLPQKFVAKSVFGSGSRHVLIVQDKSKLNFELAKYRFSNWLQPWNNVYYHTFDWAYKDIPPRIIVEKYISDRKFEYDFFCFNGEPKFLWVAKDSSPNMKNYRNIYDINWKLMPVRRNAPNFPEPLKRPSNFDEMIEIARALSKPFPHVRVDLLDTNDGVKVMELTFYTGSGFHAWSPIIYDTIFGDYFDLKI